MVSTASFGESTIMAEDKFTLARKILLVAVRPALDALQMGGRGAEQTVPGTTTQKKVLIHRQQLGGGPALGLFQMEPATHDDCWNNYLNFRSGLANKVRSTLEAGQAPVAQTLKVNDRYAAAMCRVRYMRVAQALPNQDDITAIADYWKQHYNTPLGAGAPEEFLDKWPQYVNSQTFG
jgi:hypothetical protein